MLSLWVARCVPPTLLSSLWAEGGRLGAYHQNLRDSLGWDGFHSCPRTRDSGEERLQEAEEGRQELCKAKAKGGRGAGGGQETPRG